MSQNDLTDIYNRRFRASEVSQAAASRDNAWRGLYRKVLAKYIQPHMTVLDLGSGPGYFINQVSCEKRIAVDLDENNKQYLDKAVDYRCTRAQDLGFAANNSVDLVFTSNLFEHLGTSDVLLETLNEAHRILRDENSRLIILMPNIRYVKWDFYNFVDHNLPLNETSLKEALELCNFQILESHKKFFPYSANELQIRVPIAVIRLYLAIPPKLRPRAKQMYFVAKPVIRK